MPVQAQDHYSVLGVHPTATVAQIAAAFRAAIKACHPDLFPGDAVKEARAKALSAAKTVLLDEASRAAYDAARARKKSPPPPPPPPPRPAPTPRARSVAKRPKPPRLVVVAFGRTRSAGASWLKTVAQMHRQAVRASNPGRRLPRMVLAEWAPGADGSLVVRFAYTRDGQRVVMAPHVVRLAWV